MRLIILAAMVVLALGGYMFARQTKSGIAVKSFVQEHTGQFPVSEWEHGLETSRVKATRQKNDVMGCFFKFEFPENGYDSDRAEVSDWLEAHDGWIFEGGGYPNAPAYVKFKGVTDKESANKKLREILPGLSRLLADISAGKKIPPIVNPNAKVWPDTEAPDKTNPYWEFNNNLNVNGVQYKKVEVTPGKWQWKEDEAAMKSMREAEQHKWELWNALQTRVLTDKELIEAQGYGSYLNVQPNVSYSEERKSQELMRAFLVQKMLRESAREKPTVAVSHD